MSTSQEVAMLDSGYEPRSAVVLAGAVPTGAAKAALFELMCGKSRGLTV